MRVAVLGCTGGSGKQFVAQALDAGWQVIALARSPDKLNDIQHESLQTIKTDIFNKEELTGRLCGCDAVVSCLGVTGAFFIWSEVTILQDSIKVILEAMKLAQIPRLIVMSSWCTVYKEENPKFMEYLVKPLFLKAPLKDMAAMEEILLKSENIDFTVVKAPNLTNGSVTAKEIKAVEGEYVPEGSYNIPRADVARFMLRSLIDAAWIKKSVAISA